MEAFVTKAVYRKAQILVYNPKITTMTYSFKTNINCLGCVHEIKPHLDKLEQSQDIDHWKVDLNNSDNLLTIETSNMTREEVEDVIQTAGFTAVPAN